MQRIVCRYRRDASAGTLGQNDLRMLFAGAAETAGLTLTEGRRAVVLGPPLPLGATSDAERVVLELRDPHDPSEVGRRLNTHLPPGLCIERAWIAPPRSLEENPAQLDEAVYEVLWQDAPPPEELRARLRQFMEAAEVSLTRVREKKTQQLNARALVDDVRLLGMQGGIARLQMTLSLGPQGSIRPEEVLQVLGYTPSPPALRVHRVALQSSAWRHASRARQPERWRRAP